MEEIDIKMSEEKKLKEYHKNYEANKTKKL